MKYEIQVHDIQFTMIDEDGNELLNKDGSPKLFTLNHKCDASWIADSMQADWLEEWDYNIVENDQKNTLQILNDLLEEVFNIEFEARPKHLQNIIEEAEAILIAKGLRYKTPTNAIK